MQKQSVIILGHGSKSNDAINDFNFIVETTKQKTSKYDVFGAHMELAEPSLEEVVAQLDKSGEKNIIILPYFLFNGNHIKEDIPEKIKVLQNKYPNLKINFGTPIGKEPMMADLILRKVLEISQIC